MDGDVPRWFNEGKEPEEVKSQGVFRRNVSRYRIIQGVLYRKGFSMPLLQCVDELEEVRVMQEVHEGVCGNHIEERSLAVKVLRAGFSGLHYEMIV